MSDPPAAELSNRDAGKGSSGNNTGNSDTGEVIIDSERLVATGPPTGSSHVIRVVGGGGSRHRLARLLILAMAALVSFLVVSQLRGPDRFRQQLGTESEGDLARILASLSSESTSLQQELGSLKVELANIANSSQQEGALAANTAAQLNALQVLSGTVPVTGPGIELVVDDPGNQVTYDALLDSVQELRDAGAEALACNGRRIGVGSSFGQMGNRITLDGVVLPTPYMLDAIGPSATMEGGLKIPGGSLDTLRSRNGVRVDVHEASTLNMPALDHPPTFRVARPIGSKT